MYQTCGVPSLPCRYPSPPQGVLALVLIALVAAGCASTPNSVSNAGADESAGQTPIEVQAAAQAERPTTANRTPTSPIATPEPIAPPCLAPERVTQEAPVSVNSAFQNALAHPGFEGLEVSVSIWIDGWGELVAHNPELALAPASNQKLLVAVGANALLDPEAGLRTVLEHVEGDLVLRAAGDPTLSAAHLDALAKQVVDGGISEADSLVIDVSAYPQDPRASGWLDWQIPTYVGPLSGFMVDDNRWTQEQDFLDDPTRKNGERLLEALQARGVAVPAVEVVAAAPALGRVVAQVESAPVDALVGAMLRYSDNQHADVLMLELGRIGADEGTLAAGASVIEEQLLAWCDGTSGSSDDGSGLSRSNRRSAREFQEILRAVRGAEIGQRLRTQLPVGGVSGTLASRFGDDVGRVAAKTGTIVGGRSLSGYTKTDSGREAVFSIIVNGEPELSHESLPAIDALVGTILRS